MFADENSKIPYNNLNLKSIKYWQKIAAIMDPVLFLFYQIDQEI